MGVLVWHPRRSNEEIAPFAMTAGAELQDVSNKGLLSSSVTLRLEAGRRKTNREQAKWRIEPHQGYISTVVVPGSSQPKGF